jgi:hypothetical protein
MPKKKKGAPEPEVAEAADPSVTRAARPAKAAPEAATLPTHVLPCQISPPAPLLPLWDEKRVAAAFDEAGANGANGANGAYFLVYFRIFRVL